MTNENKSIWSDDFDYCSHLTSDRDDANSNYDRLHLLKIWGGHVPTEKLPGEIDSQMTEPVRETLARRRWVLLCWMLAWWIPSLSFGASALVLCWVSRCISRVPVWRSGLQDHPWHTSKHQYPWLGRWSWPLAHPAIPSSSTPYSARKV